MRNPDFRQGGYYSLLEDKGTPVIARDLKGEPIIGFIERTNGTSRPVYPMGGGCGEDNYCRAATIPLKFTLFMLNILTGKDKQGIYQELLRAGDVFIRSNGHADI